MDKKFYCVVLASALNQPPPSTLHFVTWLVWVLSQGSNIWWLKYCHPHGVEADVGSQLCPCCHVVCQCTHTFPDMVKMDMADALTLCVDLKNRLVVQMNPIDKLCLSKWGFLPIIMFSLVYTVGLCYVTNQATSVDCDLSDFFFFF